LFKISTRSSGIDGVYPSVYGLMLFKCGDAGTPNPGMGGPLGSAGVLIVTSFGEQGIMFFIYQLIYIRQVI
jgi:hypothetical protein